MRRLVEFLRESWPRLSFELMVLVVGITLSLAVNEWRTGLENRGTERRSLMALRDNLASDTTMLGLQSRRLERMIRVYSLLLSPDSAARLPDDSIDVYMDLAMTYVTFPRNDVAYEEMRQTGQSRFIRDKELLNRTIDLYTRAYYQAAEWDGINRGFILDRMIPYLDDHGPYVEGASQAGVMDGLAPIYHALKGQDRFRNLLRTNRLYKEAQLSVYALTRARVDSLVTKLDGALR